MDTTQTILRSFGGAPEAVAVTVNYTSVTGIDDLTGAELLAVLRAHAAADEAARAINLSRVMEAKRSLALLATFALKVPFAQVVAGIDALFPADSQEVGGYIATGDVSQLRAAVLSVEADWLDLPAYPGADRSLRQAAVAAFDGWL